ncbi:MAG: 50S ribosomal protein L18e [Nanoarchaeota archaeon]|nr:50S ribosomal protein L18e [Nanoarchaeota archaeon]
MKRKKDKEIVETIIAAKKNKDWNKVVQVISGSRRKYASVNLKEIEKQTTTGDTVVIPGKVLGIGNITKKVRVCALGFSDSAREKLKSANGEIVTIFEEINKNPKAEGIKIITNRSNG